MKTEDFSVDQLKEYFLEHVCYEIQLLINAAIAIDQKLSVPTGLECMIVESFAIHLRNLITFLYPATMRPNDVGARHFFVDPLSWETTRPEFSAILKEAKTRADVEVGHLTTLRKNGTPDGKEWDVRGLTNELIPVIKIFCDSADKVDLRSTIDALLSHHAYLIALQTK